MPLKLHGYWRSSASYRVRIALAVKGLPYETVAKHLLRDGGDQRRPDYLALNPQGLVPALEDDGLVIGQSLAICEYLEELHPRPPLLPADARGRAVVRSMVLGIACDTHPLNNLPVLNYLRSEFGADDAAVRRWMTRWIHRGFEALEALVARHSRDGGHCYGDDVTLADVFLVPQMFNARRFEIDVAAFPRLNAISAYLEGLPAFAAARPEAQPDAE